jgi:adenylosuccinate synthase
MSKLSDKLQSNCTCVVGLQWGDEAKGKLVDILADDADYVVRFNGGANAGHTVVKNGKVFKFSLLPTGVLHRHVTSVIGNGVVVHPAKFLEEVKQISEAGMDLSGHLIVSDRAHVIFPYHMEEDRVNESSTNGQAIGTTQRGIGPCYQDKVGRTCGIRVGELLHAERLGERLNAVVDRKNRILKALSPSAKQFQADEVFQEYVAFGQKLAPFIGDSTRILMQAVEQGKRIIFEGAQGSLLDVDHGSYPYVTSSNSSAAGVWSGTGVPARKLQAVVGVVKAYTTRVGRGPFPTELNDNLGEQIRRVGKEYGTVTGRPRRCGWFDVVAAKYTAAVSGADRLAVMLLDVLSGLPELKICTAYELDGERIDYFPGDEGVLEKCKPVLEAHEPWTEAIDQVKEYGKLPAAARRYVERIAELVGVPLTVVSVGPDHGQTIVC